MAAQETQATEEIAAEQPASRRGKVLIAASGITLVMLTASAAFLLLPSDDAPDKDSSSKSVETMEVPAEPLYLDMKKLLVNIDHNGRMHYVQAELQLMSYHQEVIEQAQRDRPAIRDRLIVLFNRQDFGTLATPEGKEALRNQALQSVNETLGLTPPAIVQQVYFDSFVLQ